MAASLAFQVTYDTAVDICQLAGIPDPQPDNSTLLSRCRAFQSACDAHLATRDDPRVLIAKEAFVAIAMAEVELRPNGLTDFGANVDPARIFQLGKQFGQATSSIGWLTSGVLKEYGEALLTRHNIGKSRRDMVPQWETDFLPVAVEYCSGKAKVTFGKLVLEVRRWAATENAANRNPGIPATDAGITAGLRRMESRNLSIPGRRGN